MKVAFFLILASLLAACAQPQKVEREPAPDEPALRVMTFNVNFGMAGDQPTVDAIAMSDADIVLLQETNPQWERSLASLDAIYPHREFYHAEGAGGFAFLSKRPFSMQVLPALPNSWFPAGLATFETPLGDVQALNVHLRPPFDDNGSIVKGYFSTPKVRRAEIEHFADYLDDAIPVIVAGDFNEDAGGDALAFLEAQGLRNANEEFRPGADTWRWNTSFGEVNSQLDHVTYAPELKPIAVDIRNEGNSDHLPILATFVRR